MKKEKHDHNFTKCLKGILFALVMLLPFFAIGTTSLYVIFNKNAKDSYQGNYNFETNITIAETKQIDQTNSTVIYTTGYNLKYSEYYFDNNLYTIDFKLFNDIPLQRFGFNFKNIEFSLDTFNPTEEEKSIIIGTDQTGTTTPLKIWYYNNDLTFLKNITVRNPDWYSAYGTPTRTKTLTREQANNLTAKFTNNERILYFTGVNYNFINDNISKNISYSTFTNENTLSNVFYAQTEKIWQAPLFNWVMNGPFYTGMTAFTSLFGIPNQTFFSNLLVYWLTMICIYLIIDIVLELFIYLSHFLFEKKADI